MHEREGREGEKGQGTLQSGLPGMDEREIGGRKGGGAHRIADSLICTRKGRRRG